MRTAGASGTMVAMAGDVDLVALVAHCWPDGELVDVADLAGGNRNRVRVITVTRPTATCRAVIRSERPAAATVWPQDFQRATVVLNALGGTPVPAPSVLWRGKLGAVNAIALSYVSGEACPAELSPDARADLLADVLASLHSTPIPPELDPYPLRPDSGHRDWCTPHSLAAAALDRLDRTEPAPTEAVLVHGDFWTGNLLWHGLDLVGVIDWDGAAAGPASADVAKCQLDLTLSLGPTAAERFAVRYCSITGRHTDPWWCLRHGLDGMPDPGRFWLPTYRELGVTGLDAVTVNRRYEDYLARCLADFDDAYTL